MTLPSRFGVDASIAAFAAKLGFGSLMPASQPPSLAPITSFTVYENGASIATASGGSITVSPYNPNGDWLIAEACDAAYNCAMPLTAGAFPPGTTPPTPPQAPPPPDPGDNQPLQPLYNGPQAPGPSSPGCLLNPANCLYPPFAPSQPGGPPATAGTLRPGDPNSMSGTRGYAAPGQLMTYTVEFENVGDGTALGVYVADVLPLALDQNTLSVSDMYALTFDTNSLIVSTAPASFAWHYDQASHTLVVLTGNAAPSAGGSFTLTANLLSSSPPGTVIANQAVIYFPNAFEPADPTNSVIAAVPLPTQIAYTGPASGVYLSTVAFSAKLAAGSLTPSPQTLSFGFAGSTLTAATDATGAASTATALSGPAVSGNLTVSYPGDGKLFGQIVLACRGVRVSRGNLWIQESTEDA